MISMDTDTTRPVAVNAGQRTPRRLQADNGVRANGKKTHRPLSNEGNEMAPGTDKQPSHVGFPCAEGDIVATEYGPGQVVSISTEEWRHSRKLRARVSVLLPAQPEWGFDEEWRIDLLVSVDRPSEWPKLLVSAADPFAVSNDWPLAPTRTEEQMLQRMQYLVTLGELSRNS